MDKLKTYRLPPAQISVNDYVVVANTILGTEVAGMQGCPQKKKVRVVKMCVLCMHKARGVRGHAPPENV